MQSNTVRAAIGAGTIALIVVLFIVLSGGDDDKSATTPAATTPAATNTGTTDSRQTTTQAPTIPKPKTVTVRGGKPAGGVERLEYEKGERVRFVVRSDVADEVHVHGYDISRDVEAGGRVSFGFPADLEGVFEVELEARKEQIAELRVSP